MLAGATFPDLRGRSVLITGGGSGIGAALTEGFLRQGARVAFVQRRDGAAFCDAMQEATGVRPLFLRCDITQTGALRDAVAEAARLHGPIGILVNNAANDERHASLDVTEAYWDQAMAVNLRSYFFAAQAVIPGMRAAGGGAIINFSSISYSSIGYGDASIDPDWKLLGAIEGINGAILLGWTVAFFVAVMGRLLPTGERGSGFE